MAKRKNPYMELLCQIREFCYCLQHHKICSTRYVYDKAELEAGFRLDGLYYRVQTAQQLGHDAVLLATEKGLEVVFRKTVSIPDKWRI